MNVEKNGGRSRRSIYLSLLQIGGALSIVAFHVAIPYSGAGWIAVELFFVIAGINMVAACNREQSVAAYAWTRACRLLPELGAVWGVAILFVIFGFGTTGLLWFVGTAPLFLQNFTLPLFEYVVPADWVFAPLWFVAALLQLQVLLFASKRLWLRAAPAMVIGFFVVFGVGFRLLFAGVFGDSLRTLSSARADALYCLPFTHVEAIVFGLMLGQGALPRLGRWLPLGVALAVLMGVVNFGLSHGLVSGRSLGFEFPLRFNYIHIWGYSILAFAAAALCARDGWFAVAIERMTRPAWLDRGLTQLAALTCGVYLFHGVIMATGVNGAGWLQREHAPAARLALFAITLVESFLLAGAFAWCLRVPLPWLGDKCVQTTRLWRGLPVRVTKAEGANVSAPS